MNSDILSKLQSVIAEALPEVHVSAFREVLDRNQMLEAQNMEQLALIESNDTELRELADSIESYKSKHEGLVARENEVREEEIRLADWSNMLADKETNLRVTVLTNKLDTLETARAKEHELLGILFANREFIKHTSTSGNIPVPSGQYGVSQEPVSTFSITTVTEE